MRAKVVLAVLAGAVGALALALPAAAHVTVNPSTAEPGSYTRVAFRVPTESDTASTTKVEVFLPTDKPVPSVSVQPVPGWTVDVHRAKLAKPLKTDDGTVSEAVDRITWTAGADEGVKPGQFQEFPVSLGPLPKSGSLTFKALQTYSDHSVVRWIQVASGGTEPDHPAPVLSIGASAAPTAVATATTRASSSGGSGAALTLGVAGLVAGLLGLALGGLAFARTRTRS
ncbi:YcnI family protein [Actinocatenispora rupis]|uniref:YncI copper-binding domain-containing protein n=1 Tax=Actinocatenispora rupis TaxID=519421 RepID=A0A8J3NFT0_9ACTN|nr:YcnI family protein [Actinocatenispora rupis]GID15215.1 hypothetical protein Aru02nite_61040 [Actinocatenispora rupis]